MAILDVTDALFDLTETASIKRHGAGTYVDGRWAEGSETIVIFEVCAQPYRAKGDENWLLPEGDGATEYMRFFSTEEISTAESSNRTRADVITYDGKSYKILNVKDYKITGGYYEAIGEGIT